MVKKNSDVFDHFFGLTVMKDSLDTSHKFMLPGLLVESDIVVEILYKGVSHRGVVLARAVHQQHCWLYQHDAMREAWVVHDPVKEYCLKYPWLVYEVSLLLDQIP